jgi:hypothetical protein
MIATSNFINVTGAIAASSLFFFLVFLAKKVEFIEKLQPQDGWATGELSKLELERGRPVYFEVEQESRLIAGGHRPDPNVAPASVTDQIFGGGKPNDGSAPVVVHVHRGIEKGSQVVVSRYELRGVEHFDVRKRGDELKPAYDAQNLPRFLFLGAGLMTFVTILILWRRLPDLPVRAWRVLKGLRSGRPIVAGIHHLPGDGPIVLVTTNANPNAHAAILSATDRYARFLTDVDVAVKMLVRGHMVGAVIDDEKGVELLKALAARTAIEIVPVFAVRENGTQIVGFGEKFAPGVAIEEIRKRIEAARFAEDH